MSWDVLHSAKEGLVTTQSVWMTDVPVKWLKLGHTQLWVLLMKGSKMHISKNLLLFIVFAVLLTQQFFSAEVPLLMLKVA